MSNHHQSRSRRTTPGSSSRPNAQLPAFCRSRGQRTQLVNVSSLRQLQGLLLLVLLFQLSTLLLVIAGIGPQQELLPLLNSPSLVQRGRQ